MSRIILHSAKTRYQRQVEMNHTIFVGEEQYSSCAWHKKRVRLSSPCTMYRKSKEISLCMEQEEKTGREGLSPCIWPGESEDMSLYMAQEEKEVFCLE